MPWNKIDASRTRTKVDVTVGRKPRTNEPMAALCKCKGVYTKLYINEAATRLAKDLGFEYAMLDAYRSGAEFAFAKGSTLCFSAHAGKNESAANISSQELCNRIWTATKCKRFRVSRQGEFLVLTPAYDLEKEDQTHD